mgnify:CR=1 FL=1
MTNLLRRKYAVNWIRSSILSFLVLALVLPCTSVNAWHQTTHAYIAKKSLDLNYRYLASYNARLGSVVPDFFWYLGEMGMINQTTAEKLHGLTFQSGISPDTVYFYTSLLEELDPQDQLLKFFVEGVRSHVYADIKAHNPVNGYVEGSGMWVDTLINKTGITDRDTLHLAVELAVDSLVINKYGDQVPKLWFSEKQVEFLEKVVVKVLEEIGVTPTFNVSSEFRKYLFLMGLLEDIIDIYGSYLIRGEPNIRLIEMVEGLPDTIPQRYLAVLQVLLKYPSEICSTLTANRMHWEDALQDTIDYMQTGITITVSPTNGTAPFTITVSGTLYDESGAGVPSEKVVLYENNVAVNWVYTSWQGDYSFNREISTAGEYTYFTRFNGSADYAMCQSYPVTVSAQAG